MSPWLEAAAQPLVDSGETEDAREVLTFYLVARAEDALELGEALVESLEARTKLLRGIAEPAEDAEMQALDYNMIRCGSHAGEPPL